jgi:hypothetical protein
LSPPFVTQTANRRLSERVTAQKGNLAIESKELTIAAGNKILVRATITGIKPEPSLLNLVLIIRKYGDLLLT